MTPRTITSPEAPVSRLPTRKGVVTHGQALAAIGTTLLLAAGALAWTLNESKAPAAAISAQLHEHIEAHRGEVNDLKQEFRDGRNDLRLYMRLTRPSLPAELTAPLPEFPLDGGR